MDGRLRRTAPLAALVAGVFLLSACGGGDAASEETSKRLPEGNDACELLEQGAAATALGVSDVEVTPSGFQCDFRAVDGFAGANVIRGQAMDAMATGEEVDLEGTPGTRLEGAGESSCGVGVTLDPDDEAQQFAVIANSDTSDDAKDPCTLSDDVAQAVLNGLPE
ncbi:hypothetical protein BJF85_07410 [Saccharomonospora sp. CUA-673]|nr:hypothetical protein BJF85_07410 [Saccharomonospora sp. CUA-673]